MPTSPFFKALSIRLSDDDVAEMERLTPADAIAGERSAPADLARMNR